MEGVYRAGVSLSCQQWIPESHRVTTFPTVSTAGNHEAKTQLNTALYLWTRDKEAMTGKVVSGPWDACRYSLCRSYFLTTISWILHLGICIQNKPYSPWPSFQQQTTQVVGTWPPSYFCLPNLKSAHLFWQNLFCNQMLLARQLLQYGKFECWSTMSNPLRVMVFGHVSQKGSVCSRY